MTNEERQALIAQGWTPPTEPVDPDLIEAREIVAGLYDVSWPERANSIRAGDQDNNVENVSALAAIKRGRVLAAAEAKPGMVWVKHDGSNHCPVNPDNYVWIKRNPSGAKAILMAAAVDWWRVSHYAIITQPEDAA